MLARDPVWAMVVLTRRTKEHANVCREHNDAQSLAILCNGTCVGYLQVNIPEFLELLLFSSNR